MTVGIVLTLLGIMIGYGVHDKVAGKLASLRGRTRVVSHRGPRTKRAPAAPTQVVQVVAQRLDGGGDGR